MDRKETEFANWAFGTEIWTGYLVHECDIIDLIDSWNALHGEEYFYADDYNELQNDLDKMKEIFDTLNDN